MKCLLFIVERCSTCPWQASPPQIIVGQPCANSVLSYEHISDLCFL